MRERARERRGRTEGEWERAGGRAWRRPGHRDEEGRGRQAGEQVAWRGGARARRPHSPPSVEDEDDRGGRRAGPASWLGQRRQVKGPGKVLPFIYFCFLISDICFDLNKILNHFISLCQFL